MSKEKQTIPEKIGDYKISKLLGHGGMATIYHGVNDEGLVAAVKVIRYEYADQKKFIDRFQRECKSTSNLNHANIVSLYEYGTFAGNPYYAMEFLPYDSMEDRLENDELFSEKELLSMSKDIMSAIACYSQRGLVHRDLKPSNILLKERKFPIIMDFGLVFDPDQTALTKTGEVCGTPAYMPPEFLKGSKADLRSDIYQWGVIVYECFCGVLPIGSPNPSEAFSLILSGNYTPLIENKADVSVNFAVFIANCMAHSPAKRYQTPEAAISDLERISRGERIYLLDKDSAICRGLKTLTRKSPKKSVKSAAILPVSSGDSTTTSTVIPKQAQRPILLLLTTMCLLATLYYALSPQVEDPTLRPRITVGFERVVVNWVSKRPLRTKAILRSRSGGVIASKTDEKETRNHHFLLPIDKNSNNCTLELTVLPNGPTSLPRTIKAKELSISFEDLSVTDLGLNINLQSRKTTGVGCSYELSAVDRSGRMSNHELQSQDDGRIMGLLNGMGPDIKSMKLKVLFQPTGEEKSLDLKRAFTTWARSLANTLDRVSTNDIIGAMVVRTTSAALDKTVDNTNIFSADGTYRSGKVEEMASSDQIAAHRKLVALQKWAREQEWSRALQTFAKRQEILLSSSFFDLDEQFRICQSARLVNILNHCFLARNWLPFSDRLYSFGPFWSCTTRFTKPEEYKWEKIQQWDFQKPLIVGEKHRSLLSTSETAGQHILYFNMKEGKLAGIKRLLVCVRCQLLKSKVYLLGELNGKYDFLHSRYLNVQKRQDLNAKSYFYQYLDGRTLKSGKNELMLNARVFPGFLEENTTIKIPFVAVYVQ